MSEGSGNGMTWDDAIFIPDGRCDIGDASKGEGFAVIGNSDGNKENKEERIEEVEEGMDEEADEADADEADQADEKKEKKKKHCNNEDDDDGDEEEDSDAEYYDDEDQDGSDCDMNFGDFSSQDENDDDLFEEDDVYCESGDQRSKEKEAALKYTMSFKGFCKDHMIEDAIARRVNSQEMKDEVVLDRYDGKPLIKGSFLEKAVSFVHHVHERKAEANIVPVALDDMVIMTERFFKKRRRLAMEERPVDITIGWHYTTSESLTQIKKYGLLIPRKLREINIKYRRTGSVFGEGVYVANNPKSFRNYGNVCLMCAIIRGRERRVFRHAYRSTTPKGVTYGTEKQTAFDEEGKSLDTIIGNKYLRNGQPLEVSKSQMQTDEIVLQTSEQIIPLYHIVKPQDLTPSKLSDLEMEIQFLFNVHFPDPTDDTCDLLEPDNDPVELPFS
eukprot:m.26616 g.26616  ORF g.26616 m.26616 type:complete len:443 (-) comp9278_c0_seq1:164-1492(-)